MKSQNKFYNKGEIKMQKLVYVPPGGNYNDAQKRVILTAGTPFILSTVTGVGGVEAEIISSEVVGVSGEYYQGCRREPRTPKCTVHVKGENRADMYAQRLRLIGLLTPKSELGTLYYQNDCISVKTAAVPQIPPDFTQRIRNYNKADITFYCPSPDWVSLEPIYKEISYVEGTGFRLPFSFPIHFAQVNSRLDIRYNGTASTPVEIMIVGSEEEVKPKITNETVGKSIVLSKVLHEGEILIINTEKGKKSVTLQKNGVVTDAFGYLEPQSEFWELENGMNHIVYGNGKQNKTKIRITYYERYSGV